MQGGGPSALRQTRDQLTTADTGDVAHHLSMDAMLWPTTAAQRDFFAGKWERQAALIPASERAACGLPLHSDLLAISGAQVLSVAARLEAAAAAELAAGASEVAAHVQVATARGSACRSVRRHCKMHCDARGHTGCARRKWSKGWSVVLNSAHLLIAPLTELTAAWWATLGMHVGANLYLSPAGGSAFAPHADETDVFVLQLSGSKRWSVCERVLPDAQAEPIQWDVLAPQGAGASPASGPPGRHRDRPRACAATVARTIGAMGPCVRCREVCACVCLRPPLWLDPGAQAHDSPHMTRRLLTARLPGAQAPTAPASC